MTKLVPKLRFEEFSGKWEEKRLGEIGKLVSGLTYSPDDVRNSGLLVLRSSNVQNSKITLDDNVYVKFDIKGVNLSEPNDILICVRNGSKALIGKNALIPNKMPLCTHGAFMTVFRSKISKFAYQLFQTSSYKRQVEADLGATINSINGNLLKKYTFYIPKPKEQQKIANTLSSLDNLIEAQKKKVEALKKHKKGLMQQLFPREGEKEPKLRFEGFYGEWEDGVVVDLADTVMGNAFKSSDFVDDGIQLIRMGNLYQGKLELDRTPVFLPKSFRIKYNKFLLNPFDILMSMTGTIGKKDYGFVVRIPENSANLFLNQRVIKIVPKINCIQGFLLQLLKSESFLQVLYSLPGGTKQVNLSVHQLKNISINFPKPKEQQKIANTLRSLDNLIEAQNKKIEALNKHKKGLMQQMFVSA